jgi:hypothetical protein
MPKAMLDGLLVCNHSGGQPTPSDKVTGPYTIHGAFLLAYQDLQAHTLALSNFEWH